MNLTSDRKTKLSHFVLTMVVIHRELQRALGKNKKHDYTSQTLRKSKER